MKKWWTLTAVCVGTFMMLLDITVVTVALPSIAKSLQADFSQLQWVVDAYALTLAAALLTAGSLADRFGHRRSYLVGLGLFSLASLVCGVAQSPQMLILIRGAQGIGGAIMFSTALALLGGHYRGSSRQVAFGVWGAVTGLSVALGPLVGGALIKALSWRWIFLVNVPVGAIAMGITYRKIAETHRATDGRIDWGGFVAFSLALSALVYALIRGTTDGWTSPVILACLLAAPILLGIFAIVELRAAHPMFELSLFRKPAFVGASIGALAINAVLPALLLYVVLYLQNILGFDALQTGIRLLVLSAAIIVFGAIGGRMAGKVPARALLGLGLVLVGAGMLALRGLSAASGWSHLITGLALVGGGAGLVNPTLASLAIDVVEPSRAGMGSGVNNTFRQIGVAIGIAGLGSVFLTRVTDAAVGSYTSLPGVSDWTARHAAAMLTNGHAVQAQLLFPAHVRRQALMATKGAFASGLNEIFLIAGLFAICAALLTLVLVREQDIGDATAEQHQVATSTSHGNELHGRLAATD